MSELLSELKEACHQTPPPSDEAIIDLGASTWFRGLPSSAEKGTVALSLGRDARVVIRDRDVRAVTRDGDYYNVEVSSEAHVLLRIDKALKAIVQPDCRCDQSGGETHQARTRRSKVEIEIGPATVCEVLCADVVIDNGKQSVKVEICLPVNCWVEGRQMSE